MKNINIANLKIKERNLIFEFLYETTEEFKDIKIYFEDKENKKYCAEIVKSDIVEDNKKLLLKVIFNIELKNYGSLKIKVDNNKTIDNAEILNNKNEEILEEKNPYKIFYKGFSIKIEKTQIVIKNKIIFEKLKNELKKQLFCIKNYKKFAIYRFFKSKNKYYLFNDRLQYGDDNAEQLFKYINENEKKYAKRCYFVLSRDSKNINKIK